MIEQSISRLPVMTLPGGQAQSDWEALPVDNCIDFGREPASGTTETMILIPLTWGQSCQRLCGYHIVSLPVSDPWSEPASTNVPSTGPL